MPRWFVFCFESYTVAVVIWIHHRVGISVRAARPARRPGQLEERGGSPADPADGLAQLGDQRSGVAGWIGKSAETQ